MSRSFLHSVTQQSSPAAPEYSVEERRLLLADADEDAAGKALAALEERVKLLSLRGELATTILGHEPPCAVMPAR